MLAGRGLEVGGDGLGDDRADIAGDRMLGYSWMMRPVRVSSTKAESRNAATIWSR